jgi:hypothetical protein
MKMMSQLDKACARSGDQDGMGADHDPFSPPISNLIAKGEHPFL